MQQNACCTCKYLVVLFKIDIVYMTKIIHEKIQIDVNKSLFPVKRRV